jgi:sialic acid synthase SpsE
MLDMKNRFQKVVGLSDHTLGSTIPIAAVALGASVIEKHFTINRAEGGVDSAFSMEPHEFKYMIQECKKVFLSKGEVSYGPSQSEKNSLAFRQSIYVSQNIKKGELLSDENIRIVRPGYGLAPKHYSKIVGRTAKKELFLGDRVSFEDIEN